MCRKPVGEGANRVTMVSLMSMDDTPRAATAANRAAHQVLAARDACLGRQPAPCSIEWYRSLRVLRVDGLGACARIWHIGAASTTGSMQHDGRRSHGHRGGARFHPRYH